MGLKGSLISLTLGFTFISALAMPPLEELASRDSLAKYRVVFNPQDDSIQYTVDAYQTNIDNLLADWHANNMFTPFGSSDECAESKDQSFAVDFPDSVYIARFKQLSAISGIEMPYNSQVKSFIDLFCKRKRSLTQNVVGLSEYYFPLFEAALDQYGLPMELRCLPIIESALNPRAYSKAGASGLWQFIYSTGKMYGLENTSYIDERRDPVKATFAAARYLRDLYSIYQDWHLVIAAYNCGPGNVNKAIKRSNDVRDYWAIYYKLPTETRGYVPAFIAANYFMAYYREHNIIPAKPGFPIITDTLMLSESISLNQISEVLNVSIDKLRELNPMYKKDVIPGTPSHPYALRVPLELTSSFIAYQDSISNFNSAKYLGNKRYLVEPGLTTAEKNMTGGKIYHTVKSGETLSRVASKYHVSISDIREWNNTGSTLKKGQKLTIYTSDKSEPSPTEKNTQTASSGSVNYYKVQRGDNLYSIASRFPGVSSDDIKKLNNISNHKGLQIGQTLRIPN